MLILLYGMDDQTAFDTRRRHSQNTNIKLRALAEQLVANYRALSNGDGNPRSLGVDGAPVTAAAAAFGFSRPSYTRPPPRWTATGWVGWCRPSRAGGAHKLTDEVITYARRLREQDPGIGSAQLADAIAATFAIRVHPRSV